jgi:transposase
MPRKRREHSVSVKAKLALAAIEGRKTIRELGLVHGVHPNLVSHWKNQVLDNLTDFFGAGPEAPDKSSAQREELYLAKIGQLTMELDLTKKIMFGRVRIAEHGSIRITPRSASRSSAGLSWFREPVGTAGSQKQNRERTRLSCGRSTRSTPSAPAMVRAN